MDINQPVRNEQKQESTQDKGFACCGGGKNSKALLIGIIVFLLIILGVVLALTVFKTTPEAPPQALKDQDTFAPQTDQPAPSPPPQPEDDTTAAISQQLDNIIVTDLDSQFKDIDSDLNSL